MLRRCSTAILFASGMLGTLTAQERAIDPFTGEPLREAADADDPYAFERKARAEDEAIQRSAPGAGFHSHASGPFPNAQLPEAVVAPEGQVTVTAAFDKADPGGTGVPIYLVNRSSETLQLPSQDHDLYFKLEYRDSSGRWRRAQNHLDSDCGNSYYSLTLAPGQHLVLQGYLPAKGEAATVRYRCYSNGAWTSNPGIGAFLPGDQSAAELDSLARRGGPIVLWAAVSLTPFLEDLQNLSPGDQLAAVALRSLYQESRAFRHDAGRLAKRWPSEATAEKEALHKLLDQNWPTDAQPHELFEHCLAIVSGTNDDLPNRIPVRSALAWRVLAELLRDPALSNHDAAAKRAFALIDAAVASKVPDTLAALARLLGNQRLVDEQLPTDRAKSWMGTDHTRLLATLAGILVRREEAEWLATFARTRSPEEQLAVLRALAERPGSSKESSGFNRVRNPEGRVEREFWQQCAQNQPIETVQTLYYAGTSSHPPMNHFDLTLHEVLRDFLADEAKRIDYPPGNDAYPLSQVVAFVGGWRNREDIPLFRALLRHPGYQSSKITSSTEPKNYEERRYRVRRAAQDALTGMGESVPEGVVLEEKVVGE
ncbi:MAG: hypothetical protein KDN18_12505 [Verrucomicrobiae bacterium]|nr:hypothetical protein [Verrucomicrobiae bacterium]